MTTQIHRARKIVDIIIIRIDTIRIRQIHLDQKVIIIIIIVGIIAIAAIPIRIRIHRAGKIILPLILVTTTTNVNGKRISTTTTAIVRSGIRRWSETVACSPTRKANDGPDATCCSSTVR
jgi:hypothetical protein